MDWISSLFNFACPFCLAPQASCRSACDLCAERLARLSNEPVIGQNLDGLLITSLGNYDDWLKKLILQNKQAPQKRVLQELARLLSLKMPQGWRKYHLVWIPGRPFGPMHLVEGLALELASLGHDLYPKQALQRRIRKHRAQKELSLSERKHSNISDRYLAIGARAQQDSPPIVLLDDVVTTGSTLTGCAQILKERLGLNVQGALTVAFTPLRHEVNSRLQLEA